MPTIQDHVDVRDLPDWYLRAPNAQVNVTFISLGCDLRNNEDRNPYIYWFSNVANIYNYHIKNDGWGIGVAHGSTNTGASGGQSLFVPQRGPRGTFTTGGSATVGVISTALPAAVGVNQLANRGDGRPFKVRIIHNSAGGAGTTEEAWVTANTSGTTPTLTLSLSPTSAVPLAAVVANGDAYEFLSGRFYVLGSGSSGAGDWKAYDVLTNSMLANLSVTNLIATITLESSFVALDELYVPATNAPGQGFLLGNGTTNSSIVATATSATTLTGQAAGGTLSGDNAVLANEYRNFQIRIIKDVATPTSVGQRRKITSHTAGPSAVYTVPTWTVTPSNTCEFVVENANEVLLWTSNSLNTYTYAQDAYAGGASADTWSTATYAARGGAATSGCTSWQPFGMTLDAGKNARYSFIYSFRGGGVVTLDMFDIAGGSTGAWSNAIAYGGGGQVFTTGTSLVTDPLTGWAYITTGATSPYFYRFDPINRMLEPWTYMRWNSVNPAAGTGAKNAIILCIDPTDNSKQSELVNLVYCSPLPTVNLMACPIVR